jgi:putative FmdB family regulatory protein
VPTYEYHCDGCGREFEVKQRISEPSLTTCDVCGGAVRRLLSAAPFILKGEGWYVTDYPSASRKKARESEKSGDKSAASSGEKSATDKPATSSSDGASTSASGTTSSSSSSTPAPKSD